MSISYFTRVFFIFAEHFHKYTKTCYLIFFNENYLKTVYLLASSYRKIILNREGILKKGLDQPQNLCNSRFQKQHQNRRCV